MVLRGLLGCFDVGFELLPLQIYALSSSFVSHRLHLLGGFGIGFELLPFQLYAFNSSFIYCNYYSVNELMDPTMDDVPIDYLQSIKFLAFHYTFAY